MHVLVVVLQETQYMWLFSLTNTFEHRCNAALSDGVSHLRHTYHQCVVRRTGSGVFAHAGTIDSPIAQRKCAQMPWLGRMPAPTGKQPTFQMKQKREYQRIPTSDILLLVCTVSKKEMVLLDQRFRANSVFWTQIVSCISIQGKKSMR